ncbi:hypothetical protein [Caenimonas koreensis]|uniref:Uncharacterized protein n=1 Tax=Caenimonas koreensis DSM 17982 TaxID=1121255 RepID=A0A844B2P3_9BURK|nr:hypothetical protein [Caenimonas koreensis]MRD49018.1 hypothetical protein [Caenimonas koreensis DSM 17982]
MSTIKSARRLIETSPDLPDARILAQLVLSLESEGTFNLGLLYTLSPDNFELALDVLRDWRLDRYYMGKARLFDVSWQLREMAQPDAT